MKNKTVLAFLIAVLTMLTAGAIGEDKPSPQQLIDAAHKTSDLIALGPYILSGTVVVNPGTKLEQTGTLAVYRDRERVRVDLAVAGRVETRITIGSKDYLDPGEMLIGATWPYEFDRSWDPQRPEKNVSLSKYTLGSISKRKVSDVNAWCIEKKYDNGKDQLCIDAARNVVLSSNNEEFFDFATIGGVMFPQRIKIAGSLGAPVEVRKIQVSVYPVEAALFSIPAHAIEFETCDHETPPQIVDSPTRVRSNLARHETNAFVRLYTFIDKEGKVAAVRFLTAGPAALQGKITNSVMTWRFKPATCDGRPVNVATAIEIDGRLF